MSYIPYYHYSKRQSNDNASKGPGNTFFCGKCGECKGIFGRRKVASVWVCKACAEGSK